MLKLSGTILNLSGDLGGYMLRGAAYLWIYTASSYLIVY